MAVWQVRWLAEGYGGNASKVAEHLDNPLFEVEAALRYAASYQEEIDAAIADNDRTVEELRELIPNLEVFTVDAAAP